MEEASFRPWHELVKIFSTATEEMLARRGTTVAEKVPVTEGRQMRNPGGRRSLLVV